MKLVRMMTLEAEHLLSAAQLSPPGPDAARRMTKLDAALKMLKATAARFHRVDGGSAAAARAADATARLYESAEALKDVSAIVSGIIEAVADCARESGVSGDGAAAARAGLLLDVALALYFLGIGVNSFDFVADMEVGTTVFLMRDSAGVAQWR